MRQAQAGFTLVEMLLSVAILTILAGLALPIYFTAQTRNDTATTAQTIANALRRAQTYARAGNASASWGVNFQTTGATLFQGTSYASRVTGTDETLSVPSDITIGFSGDVVFAPLSGTPGSTPTISLSSTTGDTTSVTLNSFGVVNY